MAYLLVSNILLRFVHEGSDGYDLVRRAIIHLNSAQEELYYCHQTLAEFWNVSTRPALSRGGYGLSIPEVNKRTLLIEGTFELLPDSAAIHPAWRRLVAVHAVSGVQVHDAKIAAIMAVNGISHLLTMNGRDFARYPGIVAVHPAALVPVDPE